MGEQMMFPDTIEEFIDEYKFIDTQKIYTNGSELIQVYRIKQWVDYHNDEVKRLNNIIDDLKQKNNLAENILYDYLYNDDKITKEKYEEFKGLKEGKQC